LQHLLDVVDVQGPFGSSELAALARLDFWLLLKNPKVHRNLRQACTLERDRFRRLLRQVVGHEGYVLGASEGHPAEPGPGLYKDVLSAALHRATELVRHSSREASIIVHTVRRRGRTSPTRGRIPYLSRHLVDVLQRSHDDTRLPAVHHVLLEPSSVSSGMHPALVMAAFVADRLASQLSADPSWERLSFGASTLLGISLQGSARAPRSMPTFAAHGWALDVLLGERLPKDLVYVRPPWAQKQARLCLDRPAKATA
jgi:hypothetical protein